MNLFEIDQEIMSCIDEESGELLDEEKFEELQIARDVKIENLGCWIKNLEAEAAALKAEEQAFNERRKSVERQIANKKQYLGKFLGGQKFETARVKMTFRKSETLEIAEGVTVPEEFLKYKEPEINKADLKKAVKAGLEIDGVSIVEKQNLQIK